MKYRRNGFTLIELLAVIIILGLLMLIAIPSVTAYINNSRKEGYIDTAIQYIKGATNLVNSGSLDIYDPEATYYIPSTCIELETGGDSPYGGKFSPAYIVVTYDNETYNYYWISRDDNGIGINKPIKSTKLDKDNLSSGVKEIEVEPSYGIDGRTKIIEFTDDCSSSKDPAPITTMINGDTGDTTDIVTYPDGKDKETVTPGEIVTIGTEDFYVLNHTTDGDLVLMAKYNLKVGKGFRIVTYNYVLDRTYTSSDEHYGHQQSQFMGDNNTSYYDCVLAFDRNVIDTHLNNYKNYLSGFGAYIKEIRLVTASEKGSYGTSMYDIIFDRSYWLNDYDGGHGAVKVVEYHNRAIYSSVSTDEHCYGIRPVVII